MKKLVRTSLLMLALSCTAYAGLMPFPVAGPQPTPTNTQTSAQEPTTSDTQDQSTTESNLTEAMLSVINTLLSLL